MKEKIKRISSSTWALLLALMMVVSSFSVLAATTNVEKTGTISYWVLRGDFNSWSTDIQYRFGGANGGSITYDLSSKKGSQIKFRTDAYENEEIHFNSSNGTVTDNTEVQLNWNTDNVMYYTVPSDSNGMITFKVTVRDGNNYLTVTAGSGGSTTTDLYLCGYINGSDVGHGDNHYKLTQSDDKYSGTFTFTTDAQYVTISNGTKAYVASADNAGNGTVAGSKSPTNESPNPKFKWMVDTRTSKTITFTWDDKNKTLSWVNGSVDPTPSGNYYLIGELSYGDTKWNPTEAAKISENKFTDVDGKYVSRELTYSGEKWFRIYDGTNELGCTGDTTIPSQKDTNIKLVSEGRKGSLKIAGLTRDQKYKIYIQDECIWYELAEDPVATSVDLSPDSDTKNTGESVTLTANANTPVSGELTYTFTETTSGATTTPIEEKSSNGTAQATFTNLSEGTHTYKVVVSKTNYTSVEKTISIVVSTPHVATGVSISATPNEIYIGETSTLTAVAQRKLADRKVTYTFYKVNADGTKTEISKVENTTESNASITVIGTEEGTFNYSVTVSATNCNSVSSKDNATVTVSKKASATNVSLTGVTDGSTVYVGEKVTLNVTCVETEGASVKYNYYLGDTLLNSTPTTNTSFEYTLKANDVGSKVFKVEVVADNYETVSSNEINITVAKKAVANAVTISTSDTEVANNSSFTLTAEVDAPATENLTYKFIETNGAVEAQSGNSASQEFKITNNGTYTFKVEVSADGFNTVTSTNTVQVKVVDPPKDLYLIGDFDNTEDHKWNAEFKYYKFEYVNGKYVLKDVPFTNSSNNDNVSYFRIYESDNVQYSSTLYEGNNQKDQPIEDGETVSAKISTDKAFAFSPAVANQYVDIIFDLTNLTVTVNVVREEHNVTAKYQTTEDGVTYSAEMADTNIVTVDGAESSTTSSGTVAAKNTITIGGSTYVFAGWESENGSFTDASKASTKFSPTSNGDVIAQYKKQYTVSASTTGGNGTINVGNTTYLAGDTVTINIVPYTSYQLASLKRTTGTSGETTDVKAGVSNNKYVVPKISSNEIFVATFEKIPLDYSKYRLCGLFDDSNKWSYDNGIEFDTNGKATFTIAQPASGDNGQFSIARNDGSKTITYGCGQQTEVQIVEDGVPYTPVENSNKPYRVPSEGSYVVEIVDIDSNGVPKFKVTKDDTISDFELIKSDTKTGTGSTLGHFTKGSDDGKIVTKLITVNDGTYYFHVKKGNVNYCSGANLTLGSSTNLNRYYDNIEGVQYKLSAGSYKVTYYDIKDTGEGQFKIESIAKPLAESVTLSPSATAVKTDNEVTLTAKINGTHVEDSNASYTYTFYEGEGENKKVGETTTTDLTATCKTKSDKEGKVSYHVVVSTKSTYIDPKFPTFSLTYTDISSETIQVDYREKILYIAKVVGGKIGQRRALTQDSFKPQDQSVTELTVALFTDKNEISEDTIVNLGLNSIKNKYTTVTSSTLDDGTVSGGIPTYTIKCNEGTGDLTVYIRDDQIYATASLKNATSKTFDSIDTVDYYFAEPTDNTDISKPTSGDGLRIYYWNNSVAERNDYADVTTAVNKNGTNVTTGTDNTITVNMGDLYPSGVTGTKQFYVYKVSLPVWATSFKFISSDTTEIPTFSTFVPGTAGDASIGLNPNRIYLLYKNGSSCYSRGVVLDSSFWTETSRDNNDVPTKNFKTNAVNYATGYDGSVINNGFNDKLNKLYDSSYSNPLFFGYMTQSPVNNSNFRIQDNLAMRHDNDHAYYASVQGLAGNTLSSTSKNENGCGYLLTADGSGNMPLFDYDKLRSNTDVAGTSNVYEGLNFPFNESTFNGITTYSYDSFTDKNREINTSKKDFDVTSYKNATVGSDNGVGFFPFEQFTDTTKTNTHKYGFGTEFDIDFYMSETGRLTAADNTQKDITFNFSGDDDVWVYVDGVLVLDLGGAHKVSSGSINFSTMKVIYKAAVDTSDNINSREKGTGDTFATDDNYVTTVDLAKLFAANGVEFNNTSTSKKHTLQMFYMERGSFDSNCSISFNLPQNTGLLVRNDVNFDDVNPALKDITRAVANKDYFSYSISNKLATTDEYDALLRKYTTVPNYISGDLKGFNAGTPLFPISTVNNIIRRVVNGKTYYLAVKEDKRSPVGSKSYWNSLTDNEFTPVTGVNYSLPDDFATIENSASNASSGTTTVSGQVNNGAFNLLFNQSASFSSKTPNNTLLKVVQNDDLYNVNAGSATEAMSVGDKQTGRVVQDYYTTSYTITDDKSQKEIGKRERAVNKGAIVADDSSDVQDAFYFANYSGSDSSSSAMTVNFTNYVTTDKIKITKTVSNRTSESSTRSANDRFTFVVKLSNIFGDSSYSEQEYANLTYDVYSKDGTLKGTRTYGNSGVSITADEYAIISGIPVGTKYSVYEKTRTGYQFESVNATVVTNSNTNSNDSKFDNNIDSSTVSGTLPTITASGTETEPTLVLDYINKKVDFTISFKYYDRQVITGQVAHISTTPTVVNYSFDDISTYATHDDSGNVTYNFKKMITDAVTKSGVNPSNVIDSYKFFSSQKDAEDGIKSLPSYRNYNEANSKYLTYGEAYGTDANFANHTDCYGRLQGSDGAAVSDGEDWVSYYNGNKKYATEDEAKQADTTVTSITVWFFNNLRTYKPTFKYATQSSELKPIADNKFVGTQLNDSINTFYNVRLGVQNGVDPIDEEGAYLHEYGVTGFLGTYSGTAMSIQNGDKELQFLYWSYDENGKTIASNSYKYGYRVTNNIHLYAIYGDAKDKKDPGLTVTKNEPDYYVDNGGVKRVRLNTVMNVYNCPDSDQKIRQVSVIYIQDPNDNIKNYIDTDNATALKTVRDKVKGLIEQHSKDAQFSGVTIKIEGHGTYDAKGLTYKVWNDDGSSLLTNKNRVQFTTSFKQELLGGANYKNLYTFAAMNYKDSDSAKDNWLISDNYIKYTFDQVGKVTNSLTQVNSLQ
ncbi:fibro-slime domain-containing protein [Ruminococcus sp. LCP21S3_E8]